MSPPTSGPWWLVVAMALEAPLIATQNRCATQNRQNPRGSPRVFPCGFRKRATYSAAATAIATSQIFTLLPVRVLCCSAMRDQTEQNRTVSATRLVLVCFSFP